MKLYLTRRAELQLNDLPPVAARKVVDALQILTLVPRSGIALGDKRLPDAYQELVIIRRRWSYRIVYELVDDQLHVHYIDPAWRRRRTLADDD